MKQIIKNITGILSVLLFLGIVYAVLNTAQSTEHPVFPPDAMKQVMSPILCGEAETVYGHATNTFKQKPIAWANVTSNGDPSTPPIAWVSFWYSEKTDSGSMFLTVLQNGETCLMGYGMKWEFDIDALLDIVNESFVEDNESTQ